MSSIWEWVNLNFLNAFVGGLTGVLGGARVAQRVVERTLHREEWLRELHYTNAATMAAFLISNAELATKKHYTKSLRFGISHME